MQACSTQDGADGLDPELVAVRVDEGDYFLCWRSSSAPKETGCPLEDLVGTAQLSDLLLEFLDLGGLGGTHPRREALVDVGLAHPGPHRLDAIPQLAGDPVHRSMVSAQLGTQCSDHPHRGSLLFRAVPTRHRLSRHLFLRHDCILVSKVRSLHIFQGDSNCPLATAGSGTNSSSFE